MGKIKIISKNRQALRDYFVEDTYEAGVELRGDEVKSVRNARVNLKGSFAKFTKGELYIYNMYISPYKFSRDEVDPVRPRKLLLHKRQLLKLKNAISQKGYAIVPLKIYFSGKFAKVELALGKGKRKYDKRQVLKKKQQDREIRKAIRDKNR
jgi:SsrA-binding protein